MSTETDSPSPAETAGTGAAPPPKVVHLTAAERAAHGKAARVETPRVSHRELDVPLGRDAVALLEQQAVTRVPELVPIRYGRMLVSPFTFYRGAAMVMAHDLAPTPRAGLKAQLCGDAHLANFGGFASPERDLVFDINDFDETHQGPFEWDVKRLATSFEICGRDREFDDADRRGAVLEVVRAYRESMAQFAAMKNMELWYARLNATMIEEQLRQQSDKTQAKTFARAVDKARTKDSMRAFSRLTEQIAGEPARIISDPPLIVPIRDMIASAENTTGIDYEHAEEYVHQLFRIYRRSLQRDRRRLLEGFEYHDLARKVVGVGSVGTRAWMLLMMGRDEGDPLFLQIKEAQPSVLESVLTKSPFSNNGQRVVEGQRLMQVSSDIFLGWLRADRTFDGIDRDFYVRQLWDWKSSVKLEAILPRGLLAYARACGWVLARAHARSGDRLAIAAYLGKSDAFDQAIADFAVAYADVNERDYLALREAVASGRVAATTGL
jgi:uncharacterized protein (DUF2252 family)